MLSVGSLVWIFDHDSRGARTPAERFREAHIEGETSRSWVCEGNKIPKTHRGPVLRREDPASGRRTTIYLTREAVDDWCWCETHRFVIRKATERAVWVDGAATLYRLARACGLDLPPPGEGTPGEGTP